MVEGTASGVSWRFGNLFRRVLCWKEGAQLLLYASSSLTKSAPHTQSSMNDSLGTRNFRQPGPERL